MIGRLTRAVEIFEYYEFQSIFCQTITEHIGEKITHDVCLTHFLRWLSLGHNSKLMFTCTCCIWRSKLPSDMRLNMPKRCVKGLETKCWLLRFNRWTMPGVEDEHATRLQMTPNCTKCVGKHFVITQIPSTAKSMTTTSNRAAQRKCSNITFVENPGQSLFRETFARVFKHFGRTINAD